MYEYIKGRLVTKNDDIIVIETGGIGYRLYTSLGTLASIGVVGEIVKVYTYLHVREDIMDLYGFITQDELYMFKILLGVSGVGPKASLSLVSTIGPSAFGIAVITDDFNALTKAQGIGKKGAQKIIIELKDKLKKYQEKTGIPVFEQSIGNEADNPISEAINALQVLGYSAYEASNAVKNVSGDKTTVETIIKQALTQLGKS